jgi:hypothetical protein
MRTDHYAIGVSLVNRCQFEFATGDLPQELTGAEEKGLNHAASPANCRYRQRLSRLAARMVGRRLR